MSVFRILRTTLQTLCAMGVMTTTAPAAQPNAEWRTPDPANLLYLELDTGRVIIELAPEFAPLHVENIRTLAREHFWDGLAVYRVQDNFVAQFGDPDYDDDSKAKSLGSAKTQLQPEFTRPARGIPFDRLAVNDGWAPEVGFSQGFAVARDAADGDAWIAHCYGAVGAARGVDPDSSNGAELYVVIGQAPRQLDRNITMVGRVLHGMELLSALRRGPALTMGLHLNPAQYAPIRSVRLASELPESQRVPIQVQRTDSAAFRSDVEERRNRKDEFFQYSAGHIDLCNVPVNVRMGRTR